MLDGGFEVRHARLRALCGAIDVGLDRVHGGLLAVHELCHVAKQVVEHRYVIRDLEKRQ